jgi:hypothetical protein
VAYAALRPDGQWSVMLINKDYDHPHPGAHSASGRHTREWLVRGPGRDVDIRECSVSVALREEGQPR